MQHRRTHSSQRFLTLRDHLTAIVIAFFFVAAVWWMIVYSGGKLSADITDVGNLQQQNSSPVVYSVGSWFLSIKTTKKFTSTVSMTFFVVFDPKNVLLQLEKAHSIYNYTYAPGMDTMVQVTVFSKGTVQAWTEIYSVPMNGTAENVTISNAGVLRENGKFETLAIQKNSQ